MSNRFYNQFHSSLEKRVVSVYAKVTFGAAGAPTLDKVNSKIIASVTRASTGKLVFALTDNFVKLLAAHRSVNSGASAPTAPSFYISSDASTSNSAPAITVVANAAGTATDPASGEVHLFEFVFGDSTAI